MTWEKEAAGYLKDQVITRTDLGFISDDDLDGFYFNPHENVSVNANRFVNDFDEYSIMMTTDLFHDEACKEIQERHRSKELSKKN
jgi:hypothetical protein